MTPTPPTGIRTDGGALGAVPRPGLATDLGTFGPGIDGSGDFLSFASELSPASTMSAYADQLVSAGYQDVGRQGAWRVFSDPSLTLWVRVGSGGPPTSLIVRVAPTAVVVAGVPDQRATLSAETGPGSQDTGAASSGTDPRGSVLPDFSARRPDPPHAGPRSGVGSGTGPATGSGTSGTASSGSPAVGSGTGTATGNATPGTGGAGPVTGTGTGTGAAGGGSPRP